MQVFGLILLVGLIGFAASAAVSIEAVFIFIVVYVLGLIVLGWVLSFMSKRQVGLVVAAPRTTVEQAIVAHFKGVGWKPVNGKGDLNFQSRGMGMGSYGSTHPVVSISLENSSERDTEVGVWMSEWVTRAGMVTSCDRVLSKRFTLMRKLTQMSSTTDLQVGNP